MERPPDLTAPQKKALSPKPRLPLWTYVNINVATAPRPAFQSAKIATIGGWLSDNTFLGRRSTPTRRHCPGAKANPENEYPESCSIYVQSLTGADLTKTSSKPRSPTELPARRALASSFYSNTVQHYSHAISRRGLVYTRELHSSP